MKADIGISEKNSHEVAIILNALLADEQVLYTNFEEANQFVKRERRKGWELNA